MPSSPSRGGVPRNPDWYHNLIATPDVTIEVGDATVAVKARVAEAEERAHLGGAEAPEPGLRRLRTQDEPSHPRGGPRARPRRELTPAETTQPG